MEGASTEERAALWDVMRRKLWWCEEREAERDSKVNERCTELPGCSDIDALGFLAAVPPEGRTNLPSRLWACLEGITPASSVPQWAPLPAHLLAVWWHLHPFLFLAVSTSCYIVHLFSTCDSIRYLVSGVFHPLCFDNCLPSVWKGQGGVSSFRWCSPHLGAVVLAAQGISPLRLLYLQPVKTSDRDIWFTQRCH